MTTSDYSEIPILHQKTTTEKEYNVKNIEDKVPV